MFSQLSEFLNAKWLLHGEAIASYVPVFLHLINGGRVDASIVDKLERDKFTPYVVNGQGAVLNSDYINLNDPRIPEETVAVIPIMGIITGRGSQEIERKIQMANDNPNIISILLLMNTPGGMVYYTDILANCIKNSQTPILAYVRNVCASAGMWIASAAQKVMVSSQLDELGSIGVKCSIMDINSMLTSKLGINIWEIYASKSTDKNGDIRQLMADGNQESIVASLDHVNEIFHQTIQDNLGIASNSDVFSGKVYYAQQAISMGLAHEITSFNDAIKQTFEAGCVSTIKRQLLT